MGAAVGPKVSSDLEDGKSPFKAGVPDAGSGADFERVCVKVNDK